MVLSARVIKNNVGHRHYCVDCSRTITGLHISSYGMADLGDQPFTARFHPECFPYVRDEKIVLAKAAAAHLVAHPEWTIDRAIAAANGRCEVVSAANEVL